MKRPALPLTRSWQDLGKACLMLLGTRQAAANDRLCRCRRSGARCTRPGPRHELLRPARRPPPSPCIVIAPPHEAGFGMPVDGYMSNAPPARALAPISADAMAGEQNVPGPFNVVVPLLAGHGCHPGSRLRPCVATSASALARYCLWIPPALSDPASALRAIAAATRPMPAGRRCRRHRQALAHEVQPDAV